MIRTHICLFSFFLVFVYFYIIHSFPVYALLSLFTFIGKYIDKKWWTFQCLVAILSTRPSGSPATVQMQASAAKSWYIHEFGNADWRQPTSISLVQMPFTLEFCPFSCLHDKLTTLDLYLLQPQSGTVSAIWGPWFFLIPVMVFIYRKTLPYSHELRRASSGAAARMPQLKQVGPSCGSTCLSMCLESQGLPMDPQLIETWPQVRLENHPWTRGQVCVFLFKMTKVG